MWSVSQRFHSILLDWNPGSLEARKFLRPFVEFLEPFPRSFYGAHCCPASGGCLYRTAESISAFASRTLYCKKTASYLLYLPVVLMLWLIVVQSMALLHIKAAVANFFGLKPSTEKQHITSQMLECSLGFLQRDIFLLNFPDDRQFTHRSTVFRALKPNMDLCYSMFFYALLVNSQGPRYLS